MTDALPALAILQKKWTPLEVSIVSVPADPTVGVGRSEGMEGIEEGLLDLELLERIIRVNENQLKGERIWES